MCAHDSDPLLVEIGQLLKNVLVHAVDLAALVPGSDCAGCVGLYVQGAILRYVILEMMNC